MEKMACGKIRQFRKVLAMILLPLLLVLMIVQVAFACECGDIDWERAMCPQENKTVILGNAISGPSVGSSHSSSDTVNYTLLVDVVFKEGPINVTWITEDTIIMSTPRDCSHMYTLNETTYVMIGVTDEGGVFRTSNCTMQTSDYFDGKDELQDSISIVWGDEEPNCGGD